MKGLEDQLLVDVIKSERPDLEEKKDALVVSIADDQRQLRDIEEQILSMLASASGNILGKKNCFCFMFIFSSIFLFNSFVFLSPTIPYSHFLSHPTALTLHPTPSLPLQLFLTRTLSSSPYLSLPLTLPIPLFFSLSLPPIQMTRSLSMLSVDQKQPPSLSTVD